MNLSKFNLLLLVFACIFAGCSKDSETSVDTTKMSVNENGIPVFEDLESFFLYSIKSYDMTMEERTRYEDSLNFISLQSAYELAYEEYEDLESYDEYLLWKAENISSWKFTDIEGEGDFTYPIQRMCDAYATDVKGRVIINNHLHNLKDENDIFYDKIPSTNLLKSSTVEETLYCRKTKGKRRVKVNLYYQGETYLLTVRGYKRYLWGWHRYTTKHHFELVSDNLSQFKFRPNPITVERSTGPATFGEELIINNHFQADGKKLSLRFIPPTVPVPVATPIIEFKGWTSGVPESYACTVIGFGSVDM